MKHHRIRPRQSTPAVPVFDFGVDSVGVPPCSNISTSASASTSNVAVTTSIPDASKHRDYFPSKASKKKESDRSKSCAPSHNSRTNHRPYRLKRESSICGLTCTCCVHTTPQNKSRSKSRSVSVNRIGSEGSSPPKVGNGSNCSSSTKAVSDRRSPSQEVEMKLWSSQCEPDNSYSGDKEVRSVSEKAVDKNGVEVGLSSSLPHDDASSAVATPTTQMTAEIRSMAVSIAVGISVDEDTPRRVRRCTGKSMYDDMWFCGNDTPGSRSASNATPSSTRKKPSVEKDSKRPNKSNTIKRTMAREVLDAEYDVTFDSKQAVEESGGMLSEEGVQLFKEAREALKSSLVLSSTGKIEWVVLGNKYRIQALYKSSYPARFAVLETVYNCGSCFETFMSREVLHSHMISRKCLCWNNPPGDEVYRDNENKVSIFKVSGADESTYCSSLCLMTMLWLMDKVVWSDVHLFTFYVLASWKEGYFHTVGYFSKQTRCALDQNLSCFCVFPPFQGSGFGRFLIDFSYLLSRLENQPGGPERPISETGRLAYYSYWTDTVISALDSYSRMNRGEFPGMSELSLLTGMRIEDIVEILNTLFLPEHDIRHGQTRLGISRAVLRKLAKQVAALPKISAIETNLEPDFRDTLIKPLPGTDDESPE